LRCAISGGPSPGVGGKYPLANCPSGLCIRSGVLGFVSFDRFGIGMEESAVAFLGGIGTGGELEGTEPELWLADEAILVLVALVL
jgi:hypothetical protein